MSKRKTLALLLYILFLLVPIYWLLNMSFKSNTEILGGLTLWPQAFTSTTTGDLHRSSWYTGYINSLYYVA
jgi:glycerol transport system permease protein